jgi:hypothetical protein
MESKSTKEEKSWLRKMQNLLNKCPSDRLGFYTIGDKNVTVYDKSKDRQINEYTSGQRNDFCNGVEEFEAELGDLVFPSDVHSTAG